MLSSQLFSTSSSGNACYTACYWNLASLISRSLKWFVQDVFEQTNDNKPVAIGAF